MRRLHHRIYFALLAVALASLLAVGIAHRALTMRVMDDIDCRGLLAFGAVVARDLDTGHHGPEETRRALASLDHEGASFAVYGADRRLVAATSPEFTDRLWLDLPGAACFQDATGRERAAAPLAGGATLVYGFEPRDGVLVPRKLGLALLVMAIALALGCWPIARHVTRRVERLRRSVEAQESGDLGARVEVSGRDEVAHLMRSFNRSADRIEKLVAAQKSALATASHELRSPITRLRMSLEILAEMDISADPARREKLLADAVEDVEELERLVGDLLLSGRLDAEPGTGVREPVDVGHVLAREAGRMGVTPNLPEEDLVVPGSPDMIARLVRNLLDNAARHAGGPVEVGATRGAGVVTIRVADTGPGVPDEDRERIFEPFFRSPAARGVDGAGLGLHLVDRIARAHGGRVRCLPRDGGGSRFEVDLPAS